MLEAVAAAGLDPRDFKWERMNNTHRRGYRIDRLTHAPTGHWFESDVSRNNLDAFWTRCTPGPHGGVLDEYSSTWDNVRYEFKQWSERLKREHDAPDLWALLGSAVERPADAVANTPFSAAEQEIVRAEIAALKAYIFESAQLNEAQTREVSSQLDYLANAAERLPRLDWRNALLGVLLELMVQAVWCLPRQSAAC